MLMRFGVLLLAVLLTSCMSDGDFKKKLSEHLKKDPTILKDAIEANPLVFMEAVQKAAKDAQGEMMKKREEDERKKLEESYSNPLSPTIGDIDVIRGIKDAPITLVEYSDFECPFCSRGYETVMSLLEKYNGKIRFIYKHLPLSFHKNAMPAAKYYEAIRMQGNMDRLFKFHDTLYKNQDKMRLGEKFLQDTASKLGVDMKKLKTDIDSEAIANKIAADMKEAEGFGMEGTPGFILNGVPLRGAMPIDEFERVIEELKKRGKLTL